MNFFLLGATALTLGLRHGIDIDHIAAMLDMASTTAAEGQIEKRKTRPFATIAKDAKLPFLYVLGHGAMVIVLGMIALYFGSVIPSWLDKIMERAVGVTLLLLSAYLIYSLFMFATKGREFKLRSRWMVLFAGIANGWCWLQHKLFKREHSHAHDHSFSSWDNKGAFVVGVIHGFGAETGTQVLLFASVAGIGSLSAGLYMLLAFTIGMMCSTMAIGISVSAGLATSRYFNKVIIVLGVLAALFSLVVGFYFTFGAGNLLSLKL
jgi:high-affinity nickel permease